MTEQETEQAALADREGMSEVAQISQLIDPPVETPADEPEVAPDDVVVDPDPETELLEADPAEPVAIDFEQEITMPDGMEAQTIGSLKDFRREHQEWHQEREAWEDTKMQQESEQAQARAELTEMAEMLQGADPRIADYLHQKRQATNKDQAALLLQTFPEWTDPAVKAKARPALIETWKEYGFREIEFGQIRDHRVIKALSDLSKLKARVKASKAVLEKVAAVPKAQKSKQRKVSRAQEQRAAVKRAQDGSEADKMAAIGTLIQNG